MAASTVLYLVRHGESLGNVSPGARRRDDPPLTSNGRAQAARVAAAVRRLGVDVVLSSPLRRAWQTAELLASASGLTPGPVAGFAEVDMGELADAETPHARAAREAILSDWLAGERDRSFPGGEDFEAVVARVRDGLVAVVRDHPGARIAVVTHRVPLLAARTVCLPEEMGGETACANGSITTLRPEGETWRLVAWAEAGHLA